MSKPRYKWWGYARAIAKDWENIKAEYEELHTLKFQNKGSRPVEDLVATDLPGHRQKEYDAANFALEQIRLQPDGEKRVQIIKMYFWRKTMTIAGAGMRVGYAERTARRICWQYVLAIGRGMEYISADEYRRDIEMDNRGQ